MHVISFSPPIKALALLSAFCIVLEMFRLITTQTLGYIFLPWNLCLAWVPLLVSTAMKRQKSQTKVMLLSAVWLLFFPNAPYIITDLLHLKPRHTIPHWYDVLLIYSYAFTGFMLGIYSALLVYAKWNQFAPSWFARLLMCAAMLLAGYGIYLGRFLRWNSWDAFLNPLQIVQDTFHRIVHPLSHLQTYGVTLLCGALLYLSFLVVESFYYSTNQTTEQ